MVEPTVAVAITIAVAGNSSIVSREETAIAIEGAVAIAVETK